MKTHKPRLSAGKHVQIKSGPHTPDLAENAPVIRTGETKEALPLRAGRNLLSLTIGGVLIVAAIVGILSATVLVALPADDGQRAIVLRGAHATGSIPSGAVVYVSSAPAATDLTGRISQALLGVPAGSVVQVIAGPNADVSTGKDGHVIADGQRTAFQAKVSPIGLDQQYVALCLAGSGCTKGSAVTIPQNNVIGGVRGYLSLSGLTQPSTPVPAPAR